MKHNNFAGKHSRLSSRLDFGESWFGVSCSEQYWKNIAPIFSMLEQAKNEGVLFSDLPNKEDEVYVPILEAFQKELVRIFKTHADAPAKLVEYLLGRYDFYKVISADAKKYTCIQAVNLHGTLNESSATEESCLVIPKVKLPTRVIHIGFIPESKTTVELYMDKGWQFTFRICNSKKAVESSLKFDIKIIGMPTAALSLDCR